LKNYEYAVRVLNHAIALNSEYISAYAFRGIAYAGLNRYQEALKDYDQAIRLAPDYAKAYKFRGLTRIEMESDSAAIEDLQKAAGLFFNHGQTAEHQEMIALIKKLQQG
jgi:tetratricopeptide (TPR) repeat protein